jgi:RNA polymerase sigma factor (TIGR02999 family)
MRLADLDRMTIGDRVHFLSVTARLMREILVDHARRRLAVKRGGRLTIIGLEDAPPAVRGSGWDVLVIDEVLGQLLSVDERLCRVVEMRFFGGLTIDETAEALQVSTATVERDWAMAKAWLFQRLSRR